ncbi:MAG: metal-dependent hydrolase [Haloferacaceae archaeon]
MYRKGHYGVSLLVFAPVGFTLLTLGRPALAFVGGAGMLWLAMAPDLDQRVPGVKHRGVTHTLAFAGLVGAAFGAAGLALGSAVGLARAVALGAFGFGVGTLAVLAHLLADVLTPAGVALLWPLTSRRFSVSLTTADSVFWNYGLLAAGVLVTSTLALFAAGAGVAVLPA